MMKKQLTIRTKNRADKYLILSAEFVEDIGRDFKACGLANACVA